MRRFSALLILFGLAGGVAMRGQTAARPPVAQASTVPQAAADRAAVDRAIAAVFPSLVRVSVVYLDQQAGREVKGQLSGSGTIISPDGYVVTNHHVAGRPRRIVCTLSTHEEVPADLVGTDPLSDIAVIKLHPDKPRTFPAAKFGDSTKLRSGQPVLAMGSPLALSQSVTEGIVSNVQMIMPQAFGQGETLDGEDVGTIVRWIGHDAAIYPGNSGGPLVNLAGEVVGVNEISFGLGGAIPSNLARAVVDALIKDGRVKRSWIGLELQPRIGDGARTGALVSWVADASPALAAGVEAGDLLTKVNTTAVDAKYAEQLPPVNLALLSLPVGQPATLTVVRAGRELTLTAVPVERSAAISTPSEFADWGVMAANLNDRERRELARATTDGARVVSLKPNGPADQAKPPLRPGDVIVSIEGHPVKSVADVEQQTRAALGSKDRVKALVGFERGTESYLTVVEIGSVSADDPPREARKAWVPVEVQVLTPPLAERLGLKGRTGVRVTRLLDPATPLHLGDVILAIDGDPVRATAPNDEDLFASDIRRYRVGASVKLTVNRDGVEIAVPVTLGQTPTQPREMKWYADPVFEFRARDVAEADREDPLVGEEKGVLVESVAARGWAALGRLNGGDLILAVDGQPVGDVDTLKARMTDIQARRPASVVFEVRRGIRTMFIEIQPAWK
ncbi:MAG TPA: PDZ domain-containing protein [Vicinamibacterales bacterium]|nr:PDZ domain-containing protein [Vicinamibacterales bacterium]